MLDTTGSTDVLPVVSMHVETVVLLGKQNGKPLLDENIKELAAYLGSGNAKPDDTIEIRVDADKVYEILNREKAEREMKESSE
ncbi:hypothetical protein SAMN02910400_00793 [Lachnospiraceae bacterium C10]|nr:hypothetical protein SAMN02910400_00793 [Lachnospiraceae bacterium C10]